MPQPAQSAALISDPMAIFCYLAGLLALIFWVSELPRLRPVFRVIPPIIYAYFLPTVSTTLGITPAASPAYDWMVRWLLPVALMLLMISIDLRAVGKLGLMALAMVLTGTFGILVGGAVTLLIFGAWLPEGAWMGLAALSGSWIGGTANMVAIASSVGTPDEMYGPVIVVDTVVGYGWMGVLLAVSSLQGRFDRWNNARTEAIEEANRHLAAYEAERRPTQLADVAMILGIGFVGGGIALAIGERLPTIGDPIVFSHTTWSVLVVVTVGLLLSLTRVRRLEEVGASRVGYLALYLLVAAIGSRADLAAALEAPLFLVAGMVWISIHVVVLLAMARAIRAPLFFVATGSMANVGGAASAPVVAGVYHPAMASVGLLMAVVAYVVGFYLTGPISLMLAFIGALVGG